MERLREFAELIQTRIQIENNQGMLRNVCEDLAEAVNASLALVDTNGRMLVEVLQPQEDFALRTEMNGEGRNIDFPLNEQLKNIVEMRDDLDIGNLYIKNIAKTELKKYTITVFPVGAKGRRIGTVMLYRAAEGFDEGELTRIQLCSTIISLIISYSLDEAGVEESRKTNAVKAAVGTLSYSEQEAVVHILDELKNNEGLIVTSKVADRVGITRSVIVNALRKLESAEVIESRSLGMKGTYLKVLNELLPYELNKQK